MKSIIPRREFISSCFSLFLTLAPSVARAAEPARWNIPTGGNAYLTAGSADGLQRGGGTRWEYPDSVFSLFFHVDRRADLNLALRLRVPEGQSTIRASVDDKGFDVEASGAELKEIPLGRVHADSASYIRVDLKGVRKTGKSFADVSDLVVSSDTPGLQLAFVRNNDGNMFYWGRRGPSVHLNYQMPKGKNIEYAFSELTVPKGEDPIGSYFMANGFGQGYYGIQVKSETERWVLFSVWSPHQTDRPAEIPEDKRVTLLKKGEGVRGGEFGGEGSGGQSILVYPWKAEVTYRFLNAVQPDGQGSTVYTAWFGEVGKPEWKLIASFKRPQTNTHLTGFHSFLENFHDAKGYIGRRSLHGNQWVRDTEGTWHEITSARFTGDGTASGGHRLDYAGGVSGNAFFMRNGGFFSEQVKLNQEFKRPSTADKKPVVDFDKLDKP